MKVGNQNLLKMKVFLSLKKLSVLCALFIFESCTDKLDPTGETEPEVEVPAYVKQAKDLSTIRPANCYIVSKKGTYRLTPYKGNSRTSVGEIASVSVLWESFGTDQKPKVGDLIRDVEYVGGYILFKTPDVFTEGNAVIAAMDDNGKRGYGSIICGSYFPTSGASRNSGDMKIVNLTRSGYTTNTEYAVSNPSLYAYGYFAKKYLIQHAANFTLESDITMSLADHISTGNATPLRCVKE